MVLTITVRPIPLRRWVMDVEILKAETVVLTKSIRALDFDSVVLSKCVVNSVVSYSSAYMAPASSTDSAVTLTPYPAISIDNVPFCWILLVSNHLTALCPAILPQLLVAIRSKHEANLASIAKRSRWYPWNLYRRCSPIYADQHYRHNFT